MSRRRSGMSYRDEEALIAVLAYAAWSVACFAWMLVLAACKKVQTMAIDEKKFMPIYPSHLADFGDPPAIPERKPLVASWPRLGLWIAAYGFVLIALVGLDPGPSQTRLTAVICVTVIVTGLVCSRR